MIRVNQLCKSIFDGSAHLKILDNINLFINSGQSLAIVGTSGSGKSTLLGLLAGLDTPTSGGVELNGSNIFKWNEEQRAKFRAQHVGFVFQSFQLLDHLNALENVTLPLELLGEKHAEKIAKNILIEVGLAERLHHFPSTMSGGEQQRVALARAFVSNPSFIFADEPTGSLDEYTGQRIIELMFDLQTRHQATLVLVTHDLKLAQRCDSIFEMPVNF